MSDSTSTMDTPPPSFLAHLLALLLIWLIAGYLMSSLCCGNKTEKAMASFPAAADTHLHTDNAHVDAPTQDMHPTPPADLSIQLANGDVASPNLQPSESFRFKTSDYVLAEPMSAALVDNVDELQAVLSSNPANFALLTGYYHADETNPSAFPSLGLARAYHVKNLLVKQGIASKQIDIADMQDDGVVADATGIYDNRVGIMLDRRTAADRVNDQQAMNKLGDEIRQNPLVLYFDLGKSIINLSETQRDTVLNIVRFLDKNPNEKAYIIGHTDGEGTARNNWKLGMERAEFVRVYLQRNGLPRERIAVASKGESEPIASNATKEGSAKNRRTVVTLY